MTHYHDQLVAGEFAPVADDSQDEANGAEPGLYDALTVADLRQLATDREIAGRSQLTTKPELVGALEAADAEAANGND